ncbi:MAG: DUF4918 family protein [Bacteroidales bacterium]|nr:DUF4918 family protein [Bacteroidales bacterium]
MDQNSFAERVIAFNKGLSLSITLPDGIRVMNPFAEMPTALEVSSAFYRKFYNDNNMRRLILGINPGRFGAGVTGIPFTDTKRLEQKCGLTVTGLHTHEPSSVFVYDVIEAYGGVESFYSDFYINSPSPLGFVKRNEDGKEVNFNYYDSKELQESLKEFMINSIKQHISMGIICDTAYCLGTGKNYSFLSKLNNECKFFEHLIPLEHPRYVMQYKSSQKQFYIDKYLRALFIV